MLVLGTDKAVVCVNKIRYRFLILFNFLTNKIINFSSTCFYERKYIDNLKMIE